MGHIEDELLEQAARLCEASSPDVLLEEQEAMHGKDYWTMLHVLKRLAARIRALKGGASDLH